VTWGRHQEALALRRGKEVTNCRFFEASFDVWVEAGLDRLKLFGKPHSQSKAKGDLTMRFMMLVKRPENLGPAPKPFVEAMAKLSEDAAKSGAMLGGGGLDPVATSTRVRLSEGKVIVIDGPFTEAKEVVGGFAMFEFKSKEEAIEATVGFMEVHKKHWPGWEGETEIRQVFGPQDSTPRG
jgi:hypothetical protein